MQPLHNYPSSLSKTPQLPFQPRMLQSVFLSDIDAIERITNSGAGVIATIHGRNIDMIKRRDDLKRMLKFFDLIITLSKRKGIGTVEEALTEW